MSVFRSEEFVHKNIRIPRENALEILNELGKLENCLEFIDLNVDDLEGKKAYNNYLKRCDEMENKFLYFEKICKEHSLSLNKYKTLNDFYADLGRDQREKNFLNYFDLVENEILEDEKTLNELIESFKQIQDTLEVLYEKREVLTQSSKLLLREEAVEEMGRSESKINLINSIDLEDNLNLDFLAGTIKAEDELKMRRMLFRITRGRALVTFWNFNNVVDIDKYEPGKIKVKNKNKLKPIKKKIFTIFFQSSRENVLMGKVLKICDIFECSRFTIPKKEEIGSVIASINNEIREKHNFLNEAEYSIKTYFGEKGDLNKYPMYKLFFRKEKAIYATLSKCIVRDTFIDGEVWVPKISQSLVNETLRSIFNDKDKLSASLYDVEYSTETPPTYLQTNDFMWAFQEIVDTYGTPRYREINPALFNTVTFPFLFGVMFGDIGHGSIVMVFGLYLILCGHKSETLRPFIKARYLLFLMGFFAFYCGWIYNDFFSLSVNAFGSCYDEHAVKSDKDCVYPFGVDPKWNVSMNELSFMNSFKMKLSVIIGVTHMLLGIVLRGLNGVFRQDYADFFFQFIPQLIFMIILFGYMVVMIFLKWATDWSGNLGKAPSIISLMMSIFLNLGDVGEFPLFGDGSLQTMLHRLILLISFLCVPILLFVKPCIIHSRNKNKNIEINVEHKKSHSKEHEEPFSELLVHQLIETIEFVLGAVSNTASYLRLWALSLAHGQLSRVFFEKTLSLGLQQDSMVYSVIFLFLGYFMFANITFFVLICMDNLECFLHTLRLHWVEFQNKFFKADGYKFSPYSFKAIISLE